MAEAVTPEAVVAWFTEYQTNHIVKDGVIPEWFLGIISRKLAEEMLITKPPGYFLIRVSESRIGYTLSYRAKDRCRHFMIDMLPGNQCEVVGEKMRHCSLHDLVAFHHRAPIRPFTDLLTVACGQVSKDKADYAELIFPNSNVCPPGTDVWLNMSTQVRPEVSEDTPPALPARRMVSPPPFLNQNPSSRIPPDVSPSFPKLYPCLEWEMSALDLDKMGSPLNPLARPRSKFSDTPPESPTRRRSAHARTTTAGDQPKALPTGCAERQSEDRAQQKNQAESKHIRISLAQCRKIFRKKRHHSEEHTYTEIDDAKAGKEPAALQMASNRDQQELSRDEQDPTTNTEDGVVSGPLPGEYLNPPPFAPGY